MSRDVCQTCHRVVRDFDEQAEGSTSALPAHGCDAPRGSMPWNDGRHVRMEHPLWYVPIGHADHHDPGDEDRS